MSTSCNAGITTNGLILSISADSMKSFKGPAIQNLANSLSLSGVGTGNGYSGLSYTNTSYIPGIGDTTYQSALIENNYVNPVNLGNSSFYNFYPMTSSSSLTIATGSQLFVLDAGGISTRFTAGDRLRAVNTTTPSNFMEGAITSLVGGITINVDTIGGTGTFAAWTFTAGISTNCCPNLFNFCTSSYIPITGSTLYTYGIVYYSATGYTHPNFMYRYEYDNTSPTNVLLIQGGLFDTNKRISLGGGWYWAWNTFTTQPTSLKLYAYAFYYNYSLFYDRLSIAKVLLAAGDYSTLHPRYWPDPGVTRSSTQALTDVIGNNTTTTFGLVYGTDGLYNFDGTNSYITVAHSASLVLLNNWTLSAWVYRSVAGVQHCIIEKYDWTLGTGGYYLRITSSNVIETGIVNQNISGQTISSITNIAINTWYHICATYNTSTKTVTIYINGVQDATSNAISQTPIASTVSLKIGARGNDLGGKFNGKILGVTIYSRDLLASEIAQNFNATRGKYGI